MIGNAEIQCGSFPLSKKNNQNSKFRITITIMVHFICMVTNRKDKQNHPLGSQKLCPSIPLIKTTNRLRCSNIIKLRAGKLWKFAKWKLCKNIHKYIQSSCNYDVLSGDFIWNKILDFVKPCIQQLNVFKKILNVVNFLWKKGLGMESGGRP